MRILQRRPLTFLSAAVGTAALALVFTGFRPMMRPAMRLVLPPFPGTFSATITRTGPLGSTTFHANSTVNGSGNSATGTRTLNFSEIANGHTANFTATSSLTERRLSASSFTATDAAKLTETVNGKTASLSATGP